MGSAASNRTSADRPAPITRLAPGLALATLMLFAPGAAANRIAIANVDGGGTGAPAVTTRTDPALVRGSQVPPRTSDVIRHGKSRRSKPARVEAFRDQRAESAIERQKGPRLVQQVGKFNLAAAASQRMLRPCGHDQRIMEKNLSRMLFPNGTGQPSDH